MKTSFHSILPASSLQPSTVLIVAMGDSVHTRRFLDAALNEEMRFILMPVSPGRVTASERFVPVSDPGEAARLRSDQIGLWTPVHYAPPGSLDDLPPPLEFQNRSAFQSGVLVANAVKRLRPRLVHSMELQMAGYACLAAARHLGEDFPPWLVSNWGSDLYLYRKLDQHRPVLAELLQRATAYVSECTRDIVIARQLGFRGTILPSLPATGGMDQATLPKTSPPSERTDILVKGYHGWAGRGLHILSAFHLAASDLRRFRIRVRHATPAVVAMMEALREEDDLDIAEEPYLTSHKASIDRLAQARLSVSLGISGGIDTTMLESMSVGTFPITTCATCAGEWLEPGRDGFVLDPHDVTALAQALTVAANDDGLVDRAALRNRNEAMRRWNSATNCQKIRANYLTALDAALDVTGSMQG